MLTTVWRMLVPDMSFLEMLDLLNDRLIRQGERPIEFDHRMTVDGVYAASAV